jgi:hypothetical protein
MAAEIVMPKVDMVMENGTFIEWLKQEGDFVSKGDPLFIIGTDKADIEVEAPASGQLANLGAKPEDIVPVSQVTRRSSAISFNQGRALVLLLVQSKQRRSRKGMNRLSPRYRIVHK